jgi:hypothetical protein
MRSLLVTVEATGALRQSSFLADLANAGPAFGGAMTAAIVQVWRGGDRTALDVLLPLVYKELRRRAHAPHLACPAS